MEQITSLTSANTQSMVITTAAISGLQLDLQYYYTQKAWMYSVQYEDFAIQNQTLHLSYNVLDKYKNILPCGLYVKSLDGGEPLFCKDFVYPRIQLFLLNSDEVQLVHTKYFRAYLYE